MITAIDTMRSVARAAAEDPPALRSVPDEPLPGLGSGAPAASLAGLLPRVAMILIRLLIARTPEGKNPPSVPPGSLRLVAQALATFLPLLDFDWLPSDPGAIPKPTGRAYARIDYLRQERAARARLRATAARHRPARPARPVRRVQPDRPPESRAAAVFGLTVPDDDLWHDLLDLTSETLETFIGFDHQAGIHRCAELIEVLAESFDEPRPAAA